MKLKSKKTMKGLLLLVGVLLIQIPIYYWDFQLYTKFNQQIDKIKIGMDKPQAISIMDDGGDFDHSKEFYLGQEVGYEEEYHRVKNSNATYFYIWARGIDCVWAIGFDDSDKVAAIESGCT